MSRRSRRMFEASRLADAFPGRVTSPPARTSSLQPDFARAELSDVHLSTITKIGRSGRDQNVSWTAPVCDCGDQLAAIWHRVTQARLAGAGDDAAQRN